VGIEISEVKYGMNVLGSQFSIFSSPAFSVAPVATAACAFP